MAGRQTKSDNTEKNKTINHPKEFNTESTRDTSKLSMVLEHYTYKNSRTDFVVLVALMVEEEGSVIQV